MNNFFKLIDSLRASKQLIKLTIPDNTHFGMDIGTYFNETW